MDSSSQLTIAYDTLYYVKFTALSIKTISRRLPIIVLQISAVNFSEKRNHPSFVNVSPTAVIDTSVERPLQVLQYGNPKI